MTFSCCCSSICHATRSQRSFNPREKFKKVYLSWLCYLLCTKGNVNPKYAPMYFIVSLFQHCATRTRVLPKLIANTGTKKFSKACAFYLCALYMYEVSFLLYHYAYLHKNCPKLDILGGLKWQKMSWLAQRHWAKCDCIPVASCYYTIHSTMKIKTLSFEIKLSWHLVIMITLLLILSLYYTQEMKSRSNTPGS